MVILGDLGLTVSHDTVNSITSSRFIDLQDDKRPLRLGAGVLARYVPRAWVGKVL